MSLNSSEVALLSSALFIALCNRLVLPLAMPPLEAKRLYEYFCDKLKENGIEKVEKGVFGAYMKVSVENDGPISIVLDTDKIMAKQK